MIVVGVAVVIVAVLVVVFAIVPQFTRLSQLDQEMAAAESSIVQAQQLLASRQQAKQQAAQTQAQLARLQNQIPDAPEMAALIIELQNTANDAGVEWRAFSPPRPGGVTDGYQKMPLSFTVTGRWDDIIDYVRRLNEQERAVRVLSVDIGTQPSVDASESLGVGQQLSAQLALEVYSLPKDAGTGAPAAPAAPQ